MTRPIFILLFLVTLTLPSLVTAHWTVTGPEGGDISALVVDPGNPATIYAASYDNGVFRSMDGGGTWKAVSTTFANESIFSLAVNPTTPMTIYAGAYLGGVYRSVDGGANWSPASINTPLATATVHVLHFDRATPAALYAGTDHGLFRSADGGENWNAVSSGLPSTLWITSLAFDPVTPTILYAGTRGNGVYQSSDGGGELAHGKQRSD